MVYFASDGKTIPKRDLQVRVGVKEADAPRPVCYCFGHTVESICEEIERTGKSTVVANITAKVKAGECRCSTMNPKGTCCLGDVNQVVKEYTLATGARAVQPPARSPEDPEHDCCAGVAKSPATGTPRSPSGRMGMLAVGASLISALAATACCWLPLLLVAFGVSAAGVSAAFERFRPVFVVAAPLLLGAGFYFLYRRPPAGAADDCCAGPGRQIMRFHRAMLWVCTPIVLVAVFFPNALFRVFRTEKLAPITSSEKNVLVLWLRIEGMTCEACTAHVERELAAVPGVQRVTRDGNSRHQPLDA